MIVNHTNRSGRSETKQKEAKTDRHITAPRHGRTNICTLLEKQTRKYNDESDRQWEREESNKI